MREFSCFTWNTAKRIKYSEEQTNFINYFKPDVVALQEVLINSDKKLKEVDRAGTFKSDDEVGYFFKSIQDIQDILNDFRLKEIK